MELRPWNLTAALTGNEVNATALRWFAVAPWGCFWIRTYADHLPVSTIYISKTATGFVCAVSHAALIVIPKSYSIDTVPEEWQRLYMSWLGVNVAPGKGTSTLLEGEYAASHRK